MRRVLKPLLAVSVLTSAAFSVTNEEVLKLFNQFEGQGIKAKIVERKKVDELPFERVVVEVSDGKRSQRTAVFVGKDYIYPNIIEAKTGRSFLEEFDAQNQDAQLAEGYKQLSAVIKTLPSEKIISLGDGKKPLKYLFTDPLCPYCRIDLANIEETLKQNDLKIILTPITSHGVEAIKKSIQIETEAKAAKSDSEKIAIMRKYYDEKAAEPKVNNALVLEAKKIIDSVFETGVIRGVPAFVDAKNLQ